MPNDWDGTISKPMFDLSQLETSYETFTNLTKKYLLNCLIGSAHLTGEGSLMEYFDDLIEEAITKGEIAIIEVGKQKLLAIPKKLTQSLLKEKVLVKTAKNQSNPFSPMNSPCSITPISPIKAKTSPNEWSLNSIKPAQPI